MGAIFTKPLTREDLRTELQIALAPFKEALLVPEGDEEAKVATVKVVVEGTVGGHGAIVCVNDTAANEECSSSYFLLSALHVLVASGSDDHVTVSMMKSSDGSSSDDEVEYRFRTGALCFHLDYVSFGNHDFGFLELTDFAAVMGPSGTGFSVRDDTTMWKNLFAEPSVGKSVVAHGQVFLRGTVTGYVSPPRNGRFCVTAHSINGSSGAPMFNKRKEIVGVVHGSSKHRGRHNLSVDDNSAIVFCDAIRPRESLVSVTEPLHRRYLKLAEDVPDEVAADPSSPYTLGEYVYANKDGDMAELVHAVVPEEQDPSLDNVMQELRRVIESSTDSVTALSPKLVILTPGCVQGDNALEQEGEAKK